MNYACCAQVICSTARSRAYTLHISLKFSAAADHTDGLHSRLDHCMHSERTHKLEDCFNFSVKSLNK